MRFEDQELSYKCQTQEEFDELLAYAKKKGVVISYYTRRVGSMSMDFPYLVWTDVDDIFKLRSLRKGYGVEISKEQFKECCDNWALDHRVGTPVEVTKEVIARMVKDHLEQTGISGRKFAKEAGVSHGTINEMLAENRHDPKLGTSVSILKALGKKVKIID